MKISKLLMAALLTVSFSACASTKVPVQKASNFPTLKDFYVEGDIVSLNQRKFSEEVITGASLTDLIYFKFEGQHNPDYNFGAEETVGLHKSFGTVTPYIEANYSYDGKEQFRDWKKNAGYDFGLNTKFNNIYSVGVESQDTFDQSSRTYKVSAAYHLNKNWSVGTYYQTKSKDGDSAKLGLSARYNF